MQCHRTAPAATAQTQRTHASAPCRPVLRCLRSDAAVRPAAVQSGRCHRCAHVATAYCRGGGNRNSDTTGHGCRRYYATRAGHTQAGHIARASLESVALQCKELLDAMAKDAKAVIDRHAFKAADLRVDGERRGGCGSDGRASHSQPPTATASTTPHPQAA